MRSSPLRKLDSACCRRNRRTVFGVLTITGAIVGVGGLLLLASLILLFVVCLSTGGKC